MNLTEGLPKCYAQLPDPNGPEEDRLTQPYFYLDENQKTFLLKRNWPGHEEVAKSLPCWVPQFWISSNLFGKSGGETVIQAMEKFGVYVWATQLSNVHVTFEFADVPITIGNETYPGVEQYFQLQKSAGTKEYEKIKKEMAIATPAEAFGIGRRGPVRITQLSFKLTPQMAPHWEERKRKVMKKATRAKFTQHQHLKELLIATQGYPLVQLKPNDACWGTGPGANGRNLLGVILQEIRDELLTGQEPTKGFNTEEEKNEAN